jgi:NADPH2:quinone reductase
MKTTPPSKMAAVFVNPVDGKLFTKMVDVPAPGKGEVLVRMHAAPINPSDLAKIRELTPAEAEAFIPGIEGCGTVVAAGKGILPRIMLGKRVACSSKHSSSGTWAEYMVTSAGSCFPVSKKIPDEQAAMMLVNPMTALAFLGISRKGRHTSVVFTAATSALGKMTIPLLLQQNIKVLSIVRNEAGVEELEKINPGNVLNSSDQDFQLKFKEWCTRMDTRLMFDAIGGEMINPLLGLIPARSIILLYGNLSKTKVEFMPPKLVRDNKKIIGFFLAHHIHGQGLIKTILNLRQINKLLKQGMETKVHARFSLNDIQQAVELYEGNMGKGKVLLTFPSH